MSDIILQLENIKKSFGETDVLKGLNISISRGEFITLLGPSGCGKTTTLRIISGLETCDSGSVILEGEDVTFTQPNDRNVNTVFQNYALFPHMTVSANVGYSLKLKKMKKAEIDKVVEEALEIVQLPGYGKRMPSELSGGQRQRVAIARAIVNRPKVLLLDEPLGALDLQLRRQMQIELKRLQKQLGITFIYITHDQEEALNMSDRIAVMKDGLFEQIGTPSDIYDRPKTSYVASFVGSANIIKGKASYVGGELFMNYDGSLLPVNEQSARIPEGSEITAAVRSEYILIEDDSKNGIHCTVKEKTFSAGMLRISVETSLGQEIIISRHGIDSHINTGDSIVIGWEKERVVLVDLEDSYEK